MRGVKLQKNVLVIPMSLRVCRQCGWFWSSFCWPLSCRWLCSALCSVSGFRTCVVQDRIAH